MEYGESEQVLSALYRLANDDPASALSCLQELDRVFGEDIYYRAFQPGLVINIGMSLGDLALVKVGTDSLLRVLETDDPRISEWRKALLYNLGNGLSELLAKEHRRQYDPDNPLLQLVKRTYRQAIVVEGDSSSDLRSQLFVNYGNSMSACGRHYEALLAYDQALRLNPSHSMAKGNKGIELAHFGNLTREDAGLILAEAYELCLDAAGDEMLDAEGLANARTSIASCRDELEVAFSHCGDKLEWARARPKPIGNRSELEEHHHQFAVRHGLYLNLCVHDWPCDEQHTDSLFFTYLSRSAEDDRFPRLARYFNQAKEDFATSRYLLAESIRTGDDRQRVSERTLHADLLEYADYGLPGGLAKTAFATAYNILDKIAVFLKFDLDLEDPETKVAFRGIWQSKKSKKLRTEFASKADPNLFALYDISLDLNDPDYLPLNAIRHAITHRHLVSHDLLYMMGEGSREDEHIQFDILVDRGVQLLRLCKAALIYLAAYLRMDQQRKQESLSGITSALPVLWQMSRLDAE